MITAQLQQLINRLIDRVTRIEKRLVIQEVTEVSGTGTSYTDENAQDAVGTILVDSSSIGLTYNDGTPSITATIIDEYVQDLVGAMVTGNTETDIAVTYQDSDGTLDFVVSSTLVGDRIHAATSKTTPVNADELGLVDSAASNALKKLTWANLKATLKTYFDTLYQAVSTALLKDGSVALTADWDIGSGRKISGDKYAARSASGLRLEDDGGNVGVEVADGGTTTLAGNLAVPPVASGVGYFQLNTLGRYSLINPGTIGTTQTWTIDLTLVSGNARHYAVADVIIAAGSGSNSGHRIFYRATVAFYRVSSGDTAVIVATSAAVNDVAGATFTGPTAIADGIRFTVANPTSAFSRTLARVEGAAGFTPITVTSSIA